MDTQQHTSARRFEVAGPDGVRLVGDERGPEDGPLVLLLHGGGQTRHSWGATAAELADHGWRAVTLDARGHGESDWSERRDYRLSSFAGRRGPRDRRADERRR